MRLNYFFSRNYIAKGKDITKNSLSSIVPSGNRPYSVRADESEDYTNQYRQSDREWYGPKIRVTNSPVKKLRLSEHVYSYANPQCEKCVETSNTLDHDTGPAEILPKKTTKMRKDSETPKNVSKNSDADDHNEGKNSNNKPDMPENNSHPNKSLGPEEITDGKPSSMNGEALASKSPKLVSTLKSVIERMQVIFKEQPNASAALISLTVELPKLRSFKHTDIDKVFIHRLVHFAYCLCFAGMPLLEYIPWFSSAISKGQSLIDSLTMCRLTTVLRMNGMKKELLKIAPLILKNKSSFSPEQVADIVLDLESVGLCASNPKFLEQLLPLSSFTQKKSLQLFHGIHGDKRLYKYLIPLVNASSPDGIGAAHAINALCTLKWEGTHNSVEKQSEAELIHAIGYVVRAIVSNQARFPCNVALNCLTRIAQNREKYTLKPLKMLTATCITSGHFNAASYAENCLFAFAVLEGQLPELVVPFLNAVKQQERKEELVSAIFNYFGKMKSRTQVIDLARANNHEVSSNAKNKQTPVAEASIHSLLTALNKSIGLLGRTDELVEKRCLMFILRFYAETRNHKEILSILKAVKVKTEAILVELKGNQNKVSIEDETIVFLKNYLVVCIRLPLRLSPSAEPSILCTEIVRNILQVASIEAADDFLIWVILKYLGVSNTGDIQNSMLKEIQRNITNFRTPEECGRIYRIIQGYPDGVKLHFNTMVPTLFRKLPIEYFSKLAKALPASQEDAFYEVMDERAKEFDFGSLLPLLMDRSARIIPTYNLLLKLVHAASEKESVTPRVFLETILAFGRRSAFPEDFIRAHISQFKKISSMHIHDAVHAVFLLCRSGSPKHLDAFLPVVAEKFMEWSSMKYLKPQEVSLVCRAVYWIGKYTKLAMADRFCLDYFDCKESLESDGELQAAYAFVVLSSKLESKYDHLREILHEHGSSEAICRCVELLAQNKIQSIVDCCVQRCKVIKLSPKELISVLSHWKDLHAHRSAVPLEDVVLPALLRDKQSKAKTHEIDSKTLSEIITLLNRTGEISPRIRGAIIQCFKGISADGSDFGSVLYGLAKLDIDLHKYSHTIVQVFAQNKENLTAYQIGQMLSAFTKLEEIPKDLCDMVIPRLNQILPAMNASELTQFAYPLLRFENLPTEIGSILSKAIVSKQSLLTSSQGARLSLILSKPYAPIEVREELHKIIISGARSLKFQEVVGLLASDHVYTNIDLIKELNSHFEGIIPTSSALDMNWAIRLLSKCNHKEVLHRCMKLYVKSIPKLNNYETTVLLNSTLQGGVKETEFIESLLEKIREFAGKELKGNNLLTLMNTIMRSSEDVHPYVTQLMEILLDHCEINISLLAQITEFCMRHQKSNQVNFDVAYERIAREISAILTVAPRSALSILTHVQSLQNEFKLVFSCLTSIAATLLPLSDISSLLTHNSQLISVLLEKISSNVKKIDIATLSATLSAIKKSESLLDDGGSNLSKTCMEEADRLCQGSTADENRQENSLSSMSSLSAVQIIHGYSGKFRPFLADKIVEKCRDTRDLVSVPASLCYDALLSLSSQSTDPALQRHLDSVAHHLTQRSALIIESMSLTSVCNFLKAMFSLEIDDDMAVVKAFRRIHDLKDMFLVHSNLLPSTIDMAIYFGPWLIPRTFSMLQRLNEIPKLF